MDNFSGVDYAEEKEHIETEILEPDFYLINDGTLHRNVPVGAKLSIELLETNPNNLKYKVTSNKKYTEGDVLDEPYTFTLTLDKMNNKSIVVNNPNDEPNVPSNNINGDTGLLESSGLDS